MQCYNILHKAPKWLKLRAELEKKKREEKKNDVKASNASPIKSSQAGRPPGNKKAKDLAEKAREYKKFKENIISNNILAVQREALTTLADHAVMLTDLVAVSEASWPFFEWSQKKVLDKVENERAEFEKKKKAEEREEAKKIAWENKNAVDLIESSEEDGDDEKIEESEGEDQEDEDDKDDD
ncbi:hypothetical protein MJO28_009937 [Puccinia striiformis f. sp. tritici]|uniref:Uncharacterized protein n=1 Tax=Puccinia striiformis f. sp. tritici TaxID=168172 RepID=A0ACC0E8M6_9BASI|nr:hypothetical protein MJO28_009937 [Puccinia striiformis f. sp. tritici]